MKRKFYDLMLRWKQESNGRTALMIDGARRVGKSYIAEEFAKREYDDYLLIDFSKVKSKVKRYFDEYLDDLDTFFMYLFTEYKVNLPRNRSIIIFDEVQKFPRAREAIKHLVKDGRYHYIETGSLISINKNVRDIVIPSEERRLSLYPMDFEEFLWAIGNETAMPLIVSRFAARQAVGADMNETLMNLFRQYLVVGGMPQAVGEFVASHDLGKVDLIKRDILALYRADIHKYGGALRHKILALFNAIPAELSRHEKKFVLADVSDGARMRDYEASFEWLKEAMTVNVAYAASEPNVGFKLNADRSSLKCYLADTGLLVSMAFDENRLLSEDIHNRILSERIELNEGMLVENAVAQMLLAAGHLPYFYSNADRKDAANRMEIDFLLDKSTLTRRHNVSPVEVKGGSNVSHSSLDKFRSKFKSNLAEPFLLSDRDLKVSDGITYLPLYMAPLLVCGDKGWCAPSVTDPVGQKGSVP